mgnify:CR=1 FL=1
MFLNANKFYTSELSATGKVTEIGRVIGNTFSIGREINTGAKLYLNQLKFISS